MKPISFLSRRLGSAFLIMLVQCSLLAGGRAERLMGQTEVTINWDEVTLALKAYESRPSEENVKRLLATVPEQPASVQLGNKNAAAKTILENIRLHDAISAGDEGLAEFAIRMLDYNYMRGGAVDEELCIALGIFLTKKPEAFLRLLKKHLHLFPSERDYPVTMTEILDIVPDVTSDEDLQKMNAESRRLYMRRIRALKTVEVPELRELRDACIRVIEDIINRYHRQAPSMIGIGACS